MIDIHCHLLPAIDDGPRDVAGALRMARVLVDDGVTAVVCTPHILPGLYPNSGRKIRDAVTRFRAHLVQHGLPLEIYSGADAHISVDFTAKLKSHEIPTLAGSRYVLIELPQHAGPDLVKRFFFQHIASGYVPVFSHPERMPWIEAQHGVIKRLVESGVWLQITAGSLLGEFGRRAKYWSERMLDEDIVHVLATDAHDCLVRPPNLGRGRDAAAKRVGEREAEKLVQHRPQAILRNDAPYRIPLSSFRPMHADTQNF